MTRLSWHSPGERFYEMGVDRGVLYVGSDPGVAWSGLISVSETPSGGEPRPFYIDGYKYLNLASSEEFEATLNAFFCPAEFGPCDGTQSIQNGLFVTQQPRVSFGLSYRTIVGNEVEGNDHGYKIHLVYNALTSPAQRVNTSMSDTPNPITLAWSLTTLAPMITGHKSTAHMVIDSRLTDPEILVTVEDILYGDVSNSARLPDPDELIEIFTP